MKKAKIGDDDDDDIIEVSPDGDVEMSEVGVIKKVGGAGAGDVRCSVCYRDFETDQMLRIHIGYAHKGDSQTMAQLRQLDSCHKCRKSFKGASQLNLHRTLYCEVSFSCDFCPLSFKRIRTLADHIQTSHKNSQQLQQLPSWSAAKVTAAGR